MLPHVRDIPFDTSWLLELWFLPLPDLKIAGLWSERNWAPDQASDTSQRSNFALSLSTVSKILFEERQEDRCVRPSVGRIMAVGNLLSLSFVIYRMLV